MKRRLSGTKRDYPQLLFTKKWIGKAGMQDASVYVTGQNLFYITGYDGVSPEPAVSTVYGRGIDNGRYPTPRTLLFGLSVTF